MKKPAITVVVCIWNVEETIHKAVDSILAQSFKDFELILLDDGSPDNCPRICDEYATKDDRIIVYHKEDEGLAMARNYAIERAHGKYIIFFDPDDWVESDCLEEMYRKAEKDDADMLICDYYQCDQYVTKYVKQNPTNLDHLSVLKDVLGRLGGYCWNKLIKLSIYEQYSIKFDRYIYPCEDQYTMVNILKNDIKVSYLPKAFYHYMYNSNSLVRKYTSKTYQDDQSTRDKFVNTLSEFPEHQEIARNRKTLSIVSRAFTFGRKFFSNSQFNKEFHEYAPLVKDSMMVWYEKWPIYYSCKGNYHFWNQLYHWGFKLKQVAKKHLY